jgi:hypothetical protein
MANCPTGPQPQIATVSPPLPASHIFLKPTVTRRAAETLGVPFEYRSRPNWETYAELLRLARAVRKDLRDLHPRNMIDIQSFLWVQGSDEYPRPCMSAEQHRMARLWSSLLVHSSYLPTGG